MQRQIRHDGGGVWADERRAKMRVHPLQDRMPLRAQTRLPGPEQAAQELFATSVRTADAARLPMLTLAAGTLIHINRTIPSSQYPEKRGGILFPRTLIWVKGHRCRGMLFCGRSLSRASSLDSGASPCKPLSAHPADDRLLTVSPIARRVDARLPTTSAPTVPRSVGWQLCRAQATYDYVDIFKAPNWDTATKDIGDRAQLWTRAHRDLGRFGDGIISSR